MKIYHGSTNIVKKPNIENANDEISSRNGFCTSIDKETAKYWAQEKKQKMLSKDKTINLKKYINVYEFTENEKLKILDFDKVDEADYKSIGDEKILHDYDIVKGPEITEKLVKILKNYKKGKLSEKDLLNMLIIYEAINEISFLTEKSIGTLKFLYAEEIES